jgi:IS6 family transposase
MKQNKAPFKWHHFEPSLILLCVRWYCRYQLSYRDLEEMMSGTSYRLDETYVKVGAEWKYLYRAVDSGGDTIEFMLSARRDVSAAKRFFKKLMRADHRRLSFTIGTDKHASYPEAFAASVKEKVLPSDCKLRRVKYLNNIIEQDHRAVKKRWREMQCFRTFHNAERALEGVEALHMVRKGQVKRLDGRGAVGQAKFVASPFGMAA